MIAVSLVVLAGVLGWGWAVILTPKRSRNGLRR